MRVLKNEIYIQRGEIFSLDFAVRNAKGDPFVVFEKWENPHLLITITPSLYEQNNRADELYWLDIGKVWKENADKSMNLEPLHRFISTEALYLSMFDTNEAVNNYKLNRDPASDLYIGKYLFYVDEKADGKRTYKYFSGFDENGLAVWADYDFRIVKTFDTKDWQNPTYLYDIKVVSGESVVEYISRITEDTRPVGQLSGEDVLALLDTIEDEAVRDELRGYFLEGAPLMPNYRVENVILEPTTIRVGTNPTRRS